MKDSMCERLRCRSRSNQASCQDGFIQFWPISLNIQTVNSSVCLFRDVEIFITEITQSIKLVQCNRTLEF
jgi:hypothetical protein